MSELDPRPKVWQVQPAQRPATAGATLRSLYRLPPGRVTSALAGLAFGAMLVSGLLWPMSAMAQSEPPDSPAATTADPGTADPGTADPSATEEPPEVMRVEDSLDVRLVELDVQVLDRKGHPVTGLDRADFELEIDGETVPIEFFATSEAMAADGASQGASMEETDESFVLDRGTYMVLYVDLGLLEPGDLEAVKPHLTSFLEDTLPANTQVMLVAADEGLSIQVPFTNDRAALRRHLGELDGRKDSGRLVQMYRQALSSLERNKRDTTAELRFRDPQDIQRREAGAGTGGTASYTAGGGNSGGNGSPSGESFLPPPRQAADISRNLGADPQIQLQEVETFHRQANRHLFRVAKQLQRLTRTLGGLEGRRHVVYLGNRLPTGASRHLFDTWQTEISGLLEGNTGLENRSLAQRSAALGSVFDGQIRNERFGGAGPWFAEVGILAAGLGVTIHTVEVPTRGRSRGFLEGAVDAERDELDPNNLAESVTRLAELDGLGALAAVSGGRTFRRSSRFGDFFSGLASDLKRRYTLGFSLPAAKNARSVKVRLGRSDLDKAQIFHRSSVLVRGVDQEVADLTLSALAIDPMGDNPLELQVEAGAPQATGETFSVPLSVRLPLAKLALLPDRQSHAGRLSVYTTAGGLEKGSTPVVKSIVPVRIRNTDLLTALGRTVEYNLEVEVPSNDPGRVAITVRDDYRPAVATRVTAVVPKAEVGPGGASAPGDDPAQSGAPGL